MPTLIAGVPTNVKGNLKRRKQISQKRRSLRKRENKPKRVCAGIHTQMPVILSEERHDSWLFGEAGKEVLVPYPADRMKAWPGGRSRHSPSHVCDGAFANTWLESE